MKTFHLSLRPAVKSLIDENRKLCPFTYHSQLGQSLIEILIVMGLMAILLPAILTGLVASREGKAQEQQRLQAAALVREAGEIVRNIREKGWSEIATTGIYHPEISDTSWSLVSGSENINSFTRQIEISTVKRDSNGNITESGGILDPSTRKVVSTVSWSTPISSSVESINYFQRYVENTTWVQTTQNDFEAGTHINTRADNTNGGSVKLDNAGGTQTFTDDFANSTDYNFDPNKIEVINSFAQLKSAVISGQTTNSGFDTDSSGWTFAKWDDDVSQSGNFNLSGGNPGSYVDINFPAEKKEKSGGYWYQPITITEDNPTATLTFNWQVSQFDPKPKSLHLYAFIDNDPDEPNKGDSVWDSGKINGTSSWSQTVNIDVSSSVASQGTYYVKVAAFVNYGGKTKGPFTVGFDNVLLNWSKATGSYPTDSPTIFRIFSFSTTSINTWEGFKETAQKNGGEIFYQLSDNDGATWQYFDGSSWVNAIGPTDYNDENTVDNEIKDFPTTNNQINIKAFLVSDGTQFVKLDTIEIDYTGSSAGQFTSSTFDAGSNVGFNNIVWDETTFPNTTVQLQVATNSDNLTWEFIGPDGTGSTLFTGEAGTIHLAAVSARYLQYRIFFESATNDKPYVEEVNINYSP